MAGAWQKPEVRNEIAMYCVERRDGGPEIVSFHFGLPSETS